MPAYVIVDLDVKDPALYQHYLPHVPALVQKHGGEYLARGGRTETLEGSWHPSRLILFRFPDAEAARAFFDDPEYQPFRAIRHRAADGDVVLVEGIK